VASKLYVVVRGDLKPGLRAAQAVHAGIAHGMVWVQSTWQWNLVGGVLVVLQVRGGLPELKELRDKLVNQSPPSTFTEFHEVDLNNELTAIAAYGPGVEELVRELPLAFSELN